MFNILSPRLIIDMTESRLQLTSGNTSPMEELVSAIRENLKLKAPGGLAAAGSSQTPWFCKACSRLDAQRPTRRVSPYSLPSRENRRPAKCKCDLSTTQSTTESSQATRISHRIRDHHRRKGASNEEPYELLQALLKRGTLISEAVRRLQDPKKTEGKGPRVHSPSSADSCDSTSSVTKSSATFIASACAAV